MPAIRLDELAGRLDAKLEGDPQLAVDELGTLAEAGPGALSFLANPKYQSQLADTRATAVLVAENFRGDAPCALLRVANPDLAFSRATRFLGPPPPPKPTGVHPTAVVAPEAELGPGVAVGAFAVVEAGAKLGAGTVLHAHAYVGHNAVLGQNCVLYPRATLYHGVRLGDRVVLHAGAVVGADGFGYLWNGKELEASPQIGTVVLDDDVEVGANTTIDRARFGATRVGQGTKLDNLIQLGHNVQVGRHCAFAAQVGLAGSATVGDGVMMGGQVGVGGHLHIGDRAQIAGQSGISRAVPNGAVMFGSPAQERRQYVEEHRHLRTIGRLRRMVEALALRVGLDKNEVD